VLFLLWFVGGGGGGDVKLMGALSVWLGFRLTLYVMIVSTFLVVCVTCGVVFWSVATRGVRGTKRQYLATGKTKPGAKPQGESLQEKQGRRIMAYATPIALATWMVVLWKLPTVDRMWQAEGAAPPAAVQAEQPVKGG
jgi:prepilin peptidase CpaA